MATEFPGSQVNSCDAEALLAGMPYARFLGIQLRRADDAIRGYLPFKETLVGNARVEALHGGALATLLGTTAVLQTAEEVDLVEPPTLISLTVEYLRSADYVDTFAEACFTRLGGRVANARVVAWQSSRDEPVAVANVILTLARSPRAL